MNSGFNINWEESDDGDFYQYDLYHSINETLDDTSLILIIQQRVTFTFHLLNHYQIP